MFHVRGSSPLLRLTSDGRAARGARSSLAASLVALAFVGVGLALSGLAARDTAGAAAARETEAAQQRTLAAYGQLPLSFVPNAGQLDSPARYYTGGPGYRFSFEDRKATIDLVKATGRAVSLDLRFLGASPEAKLEATHRATGTMSFLKGDDPARWQRGLPTYHGVAYRGLWPGIDMRFRGGKGQLKYEFVVRPGASVGDIKLAYGGARGLSLGPAGSLLVETRLGRIEDSRPVSYQRIGGRTVAVESRYTLTGATGYGFAVGQGYNPRYPLVIDPGLAYSTFLGGIQSDLAYGIDVDQQGNAYISGGTGVPGLLDVFVTKLNPTGTAVVYTSIVAGVGEDYGRGVVVDGAGRTFVTGFTTSANYPTTPGAFDTTFAGGGEGFATNLNETGTAILYSTYLGGNGFFERGDSIQIDTLGNAYVAGFTPSTDFPTTPGALDTTTNGSFDAFVTKLSPTGAGVYSTYLGGVGSDGGHSVDVDGSGNAYVTGDTASLNFPTTMGAFDVSHNGVVDGYVTKLNAAGSALVYSTFLGGLAFDEGWDLVLDQQRNVYLTGRTRSTDFPTTTGAFDMFYNAGEDAFVTKLNAAGQALAYSTFLGGILDDRGFGIALNQVGEAYVAGWTASLGNPPAGFPTTPLTAYDVTYNGGANDAFMTKLNALGTALVNSTFLGGASADAFDVDPTVAVDGSGNPYVAGSTQSSDFPTTEGAHDRFHDGPHDVFVTKFNLGGPPAPPPGPPPPPPPPPPCDDGGSEHGCDDDDHD